MRQETNDSFVAPQGVMVLTKEATKGLVVVEPIAIAIDIRRASRNSRASNSAPHNRPAVIGRACASTTAATTHRPERTGLNDGDKSPRPEDRVSGCE
jgi:hypothetical protein